MSNAQDIELIKYYIIDKEKACDVITSKGIKRRDPVESILGKCSDPQQRCVRAFPEMRYPSGSRQTQLSRRSLKSSLYFLQFHFNAF